MAIADELPALYPMAYSVAYRHLGSRNHDDVADAVQDSMIKLLMYRGEIHDLTAFLAVTITNTCRDARRRQKRRPESLEWRECDRLHTESRFDAVAAQETAQALRCVLDDEQWNAIMMKAAGYRYDEIAKAMDCSLSAAKATVWRGRQRAREWRQNVGG